MCNTPLNIQDLLARNAQWSDTMMHHDAEFFSRLSEQQNPNFLWIGCSDSRVPANQIIDLPPGEVFVHRNVANMVYSNDINLMSVVQYAVEVLKVKHILVVGHYGCGGVKAAMLPEAGGGMVDNWLHDIRDEYANHREELDALTPHERADRMCEYNAIRQARHLAHSNVVQRAWLKGQALSIHGWCYSLHDGRITTLDCDINGIEDVDQIYHLG